MTTTQRRLTLTGGTYTFPGGPFLIMEDGGYTEKQADLFVHHNGHVYAGGINGTSGVLKVAGIRLSDGFQFTGFTRSGLPGEDTADAHNAPGMCILPDGRLAVFYCGHATGTMYMRRTNSTLDDDPTLADGFETEVDVGAEFSVSNPTYPVALIFNDELWLFYRTNAGPSETARLMYARSTDFGDTWSAAVHHWRKDNNRSYWEIRVAEDGSRIDFAVANGFVSDTTEDPVKMLHWYYDGTFRKTNGAAVIGSQPYTTADVTEVHDGSDGPTSPWDVMLVDGEPWIVGRRDIIGGVMYTLDKYNGTSWERIDITDSNGGTFGAIAFDWYSADGSVYLSAETASIQEVERWTTGDGGDTWAFASSVTSGSSDDQAHIRRVAHPAPTVRIGFCSILAFTHYTDYDFWTYCGA